MTEDIYKTINIKTTDKQLVLIGRFAVIFITICATALALKPNNNVLELVAYAWAGFGATFGPIVLLSLFWKSMLTSSAIVGMMSGGITVIVWKNIESSYRLFELYELVPGFIIAIVCIVLNQTYQQAKMRHE